MMKRANVVRLFVLGWMTFVWVLLWGTFSIANILGGLVVSIISWCCCRSPASPSKAECICLSAVRLGVYIFIESIRSTVSVGWLAIRPAPPPVTGVLRCRLTIKSDLVLTLWTDIMNNIPGTMVLEIDQVRRIVYVHVLDVSTDRAVADFYRSARLIERLLIRTFERDSEWQPSPWRSGTESV